MRLATIGRARRLGWRILGAVLVRSLVARVLNAVVLVHRRTHRTDSFGRHEDVVLRVIKDADVVTAIAELGFELCQRQH